MRYLPIAILALHTLSPLAHADPKGWKGRTVTLKQPLYTIVLEWRVDPVVVINQAGEVRLQSSRIVQHEPAVDTDAERLLAKVKGRLGDEGLGAQLLSYPVGAKMRIKDVSTFRGRTYFWLYDEVTTKGKPNSGFTVELADQPDVERLALTIFDLVP